MPEIQTDTWRAGNAKVIESLEYWLAQARKGDLCYIATAVVKDKEQIAHDFAGAAGLETSCLAALKMATQDVDIVAQARRLGPRNMNLDASYHEWHFAGTPVCWDFLIWLIDAEMTRRRYNAPPPLRIHFSHQELLDNYSLEYFECVFRPLLPLIGAVEDVDAKGGRHKPMYVPYDIVLASKNGEKVPILQASDLDRYTMRLWLHGTKPITITLRESEHYTGRNSNLEAWMKFAGDLQAKGEDVIFIRDTIKSIDPIPGFASCPIAAHNVGLRMALYEQAKCNLYVSNGCAGLGLFSETPYLYFVNLKPVAGYYANYAAWWRKSHGVCKGEQWPWALPSQRLIWETDDYENICKAWEEFGIR